MNYGLISDPPYLILCWLAKIMINMKKTIVGIFGFTLLLVAGSVFATASTWNTASNDCKTVSIANHETREGFSDPCWTGINISAQPGQSVNVRIYYHNTGTQTANNTRIILSAPTINSKTSTHSFTGKIVSDQGSSYSFTVKANLSSSQKLSYGATSWYTENINKVNTPFIYGQNGSEVLTSGGLNIGSIAPGWSTQGSVVVSFFVENPQPTGTLTAANSSCLIQAGANTCGINFSWSTENPITTSTVARVGGYVIATGNSGSQIFQIPFNGAIFNLNNNNTQLDSESVTANCVTGSDWNNSICEPIRDCEINSFSSNINSSSPGEAVVLSWTTNYCNSVSIPEKGNNLSPNGSATVWPSVTTLYTLTGFGETNVQPTDTTNVIIGRPAGAPTFPAGAPTFAA